MQRSVRLFALMLLFSVLLTACTSAEPPDGQDAASSEPAMATPASSAPTPAPSEEAPFDTPEAGTLALGILGPIGSGDPHKGGNAITDGIVEGLVRLHNNAYQPGIAKSYETSDYKTWNFNLREDAKWSDGAPITAEDFVYSWNLAKERKSNLNALQSIPVLTGLSAEADGPGKLIVTLSEPCPWFLQYAASYALAPIHRALYEADPSVYGTDPETAGCNGPFTLESVDTETVVLAKNPLYWDSDSIQAEKVVLRAARDEAELIAAVELGALHAARLKSSLPDDKANLRFFPTETTGCLLINRLRMDKDNEMVNEEVSGILSAAAFRMALTYAIDRSAFEAGTDGFFSAAQFITSGAINTNNARAETYEALRASQISAVRMNETADAQKAKDYLDEFMTKMRYAGADSLPAFPLITADDPYSRAVCETLVAQIKSVLGVTLVPDYISMDDLRARAESGDYDLMIYPVAASFNDPASVLELFGEKDAFLSAWKSTDVMSYEYYASTLDKTILEPDADIRALQLLQAEGFALSNAPAIPLYTAQNALLISKDDISIALSWEGNYDYCYAIVGK